MQSVTARLLSYLVVAAAAALALLALAVPRHAHGGALCGNGVVEPPEQCDDGNVLPADGCSPTCRLEIPANLPPDCSGAEPNVGELWPPNHRLEAVHILGVDDPDLDPVQLEITAITQNEPVLAPGSGNTCPDAEGIGTETALVRVERAGPGDGRVYRIAFSAHDDRGGVCNGEVSVCVPHDRGRGSACGAGDAVFDSAAPCEGPGECDPQACIPEDELLPPVECLAEPLPRRVERLVERARILVARAEVVARPRRAARLERRAARRLRRAGHRAGRMAARKLSAACAQSLAGRLGTVAECVACGLP